MPLEICKSVQTAKNEPLGLHHRYLTTVTLTQRTPNISSHLSISLRARQISRFQARPKSLSFYPYPVVLTYRVHTTACGYIDRLALFHQDTVRLGRREEMSAGQSGEKISVWTASSPPASSWLLARCCSQVSVPDHYRV